MHIGQDFVYAPDGIEQERSTNPIGVATFQQPLLTDGILNHNGLGRAVFTPRDSVSAQSDNLHSHIGLTGNPP